MMNTRSCFKLLLAGFLALSQFTVFFSGQAFAAGASLSLSPASGTFNRGCPLSLNVLLDTGGATTDGTDAIIFYDPTRVRTTVSNITNGTVYSDYPGNVVDTAGGKINISGMSSISSGFAGSGVLATINFTVPDEAPTGAFQLKFDFDPTDKSKTSDSNVAERGTVSDILSQVNDGSYTIGIGACGTTGGGGTGNGGGTGGPVITGIPAATKAPVPTKTPLPDSADSRTTLVLAVGGGMLILLGILGLAFL